MHSVDIYRVDDLLTTVKPDSSSTQTKKIMGDNVIVLSFEDDRYLNFRINDYCTVFDEEYHVNQLPQVTKGSKYRYKYTLVMQALGYDLSKYQMLFLDPLNNLTEGDFSLMGNPDTFMDLIVSNANRASGSTLWEKGQVVPGVYKNITFSKENCYNAFSRLAEEFSTEFWIEGRRLHLTKRSTDTGYVFKHGRNNGLYEITRQTLNDSNVATRLYAYGAEKNLPESYLVSGRRLRLPAGSYPFIEKNADIYGVIEHTEIFDDIFPHRTGTVTSVNAGDPFELTDATIDFDVNDQLLPGLPAKIVFNTGQLAGYQFQLKSFDNGTKKFILLKNEEERVIDVPSTLLRPAIGDKYVLVDIQMPDSYIIAAEMELKVRAQTLLNEISVPQLAYNITIDPVFLRKRNRTIRIGDLVWIYDDELELQKKIRVASVVRNIVNEFEYQVDVSDIVSPGTISRLISSQDSTSRHVKDIGDQILNNSILNNNVVGTLIFDNMPQADVSSGYAQVYIELSTGRLVMPIP